MFHFRCDRCAFSLDLEYRPRAYVLGPDRELAMPQQHVWCGRCGTVTPAEALSGSDLDADVRDWRARRTRPARCLRCGHEDIALPGSNWADLPHPACGGTLRCTATIVGGTFARCQPHRYSVDGDLLEVGHYHALYEGEPDLPLELW
jgi:hypothetical protein